MDGEKWQGLTVSGRDGAVMGVVVGVFPDGPLAGRLRVEGPYALGRQGRGVQDGVAVYAIPRRAVLGRRQDGLVLEVTLVQARGHWLMHTLQPRGRAEVDESGDGRG